MRGRRAITRQRAQDRRGSGGPTLYPDAYVRPGGHRRDQADVYGLEWRWDFAEDRERAVLVGNGYAATNTSPLQDIVDAFNDCYAAFLKMQVGEHPGPAWTVHAPDARPTPWAHDTPNQNL